MWLNAAINSMQPQILITVQQLQCHVAFGKPVSKWQIVAKSSKEIRTHSDSGYDQTFL